MNQNELQAPPTPESPSTPESPPSPPPPDPTPLAKAVQQTAEAELRAAAALAGVAADKLPYLVRLCDVSAVAAAEGDMGRLAAEQVAEALKAIPELADRPAAGSVGDHRRGREWASPEERARAVFAQNL